MTENIPSMTASPVLVAPLLLKGAEDIMATFKVSRETVVAWAKDGAPIVVVGGMYQADYHLLWQWFLKNRPYAKSLSTTP